MLLSSNAAKTIKKVHVDSTSADSVDNEQKNPAQSPRQPIPHTHTQKHKYKSFQLTNYHQIMNAINLIS